jgi:hypothetical protein
MMDMTRQRFDDIRTPLLLLALIVQATLLLRLAWTTSPNRTELGHIAAALRFYETGQYDLFHVNPPLTRMLVGPAVAWFTAPQTDWSDYSPDPVKRSEWATGVAFVRANDFETVRHAFFVGRAVCLPLILLGGWIGYRFSRELFGEGAGFVFLTLWTFSPLVLGWGATICPDVASASLGMIALYAFRHWLKTSTWPRAVLAGLTLGLLPLTKLTWIVAFGFWPTIWLIVAIPLFISKRREGFRQFGQLVLLLVVAIFVLNLGYRFDGFFKQLGDYSFHSTSLTRDDINRFSGTWLGAIPVPLPEQFVLGFDTQQLDFEQGMPSYLLGRHADHGWWYYYLVAMTMKEPIGTLLLILLAVLLLGFVGFRTTVRDELLLAVPLLGLFLVVSMQTGFSLHTRYIIPVLPILYIWVSRTDRLFTAKNLAVRAVVPLFLIAGTVSSLCVYPYSMSYLTEPARHRIPPPLLGSNIDWGQDLYELKDWLDEHPQAKPLWVAMSNIYPLETLGITSAGQPPKWRPGQKSSGTWRDQISLGPRPGWFLLGANDLFGAGREYEWLWQISPTQRIGESTYIFHVTLEEANRLREQDGLPVLIPEDVME